MPLRLPFTHLLKDPPPEFAFEVSEAGIAAARIGRPTQVTFRPMEPDVLAVSPLKDNVLRPEAFAAHVLALAPARDKKRRKAVLILPDCGVRVSVIDFDAFPSDADEQAALVRFRIKKSLPYDLESARLSFHAQPRTNGSKLDVVVAAAPVETVARYEAAFRSAGFQPGLLTTSTLACLQMIKPGAVSVLVKLSGRIATISVLNGGVLKLLRCLELSEMSPAEIVGHLHPTFAYAEDQLEARPGIIHLCGFGADAAAARQEFERELRAEVEPLRSRFGVPDESNAGLLGYLESVEELA